jgi:hypothetical protein
MHRDGDGGNFPVIVFSLAQSKFALKAGGSPLKARRWTRHRCRDVGIAITWPNFLADGSQNA